MWVIVQWEGEKFLGTVTSKGSSYHVRCLEKPLGICVPQKLEKGGADFEKVYQTSIVPFEIEVEGGSRHTYWNYALWTFNNPKFYPWLTCYVSLFHIVLTEIA